MVKHATEDGLQAGRDDVEGDVVVQAELVEGLEVQVERESLLNGLEAGIEGQIEGAP